MAVLDRVMTYSGRNKAHCGFTSTYRVQRRDVMVASRCHHGGLLYGLHVGEVVPKASLVGHVREHLCGRERERYSNYSPL